MPPTGPDPPKRLLTTSLTYEPSGHVVVQSSVLASDRMVTQSTETTYNSLTQSQPSSVMPTTAKPTTFSGNPGERVKCFLAMCKVKWMGRGLSDKELNDAQVAEVYYGVQGDAEKFVQMLGHETVDSFTLLSDALTRRFPYVPPYGERKDVVIREAMKMSQGTKTLEQYAEEGKRFCQRLNFEDPLQVSMWWITGLSNYPQRVICDWQKNLYRSYLEDNIWITFEEVVTMVTEYTDSQTLTCHLKISEPLDT